MFNHCIGQIYYIVYVLYNNYKYWQFDIMVRHFFRNDTFVNETYFSISVDLISPNCEL